jgi:hypothetical protein
LLFVVCCLAIYFIPSFSLLRSLDLLSAYDVEGERALNRSEVLLALENFNTIYGQLDVHQELPEFVYGIFKRLAPEAKAKLSISDVIAEALPWLDEQYHPPDSAATDNMAKSKK